MAQAAYATATTELNAPRDAEYEAFARVTHALKSAANDRDRIVALHDNRRLWTILARDVVQDGNTLPDRLRADILKLAEFTSLQTSKVMRNQAAPDVLIEINTSVMRGLSRRAAP